jgi:hypothetical protein
MTKQDLINLYQALILIKQTPNAKFSYAVQKNINMIESEIKVLDKVILASEEYQKFDKERIELAKKYAKKDEKTGEPIIDVKNNLQQFVVENKEEFEKEINILRENYKEPIEIREKQIEEYKKLLEEEVVLMFHKIPLSQVPEGISTADIFAIIGED